MEIKLQKDTIYIASLIYNLKTQENLIMRYLWDHQMSWNIKFKKDEHHLLDSSTSMEKLKYS